MPTTASTASRKFIGAVEDEWQLYSDRADDYTIGSPIGFGASSIVYSATFHPPSPSPSTSPPTPTPCALKVVDLDRLPPHALHLLMQETQLMSLSKHPNVLRVRGTWMDGHKLYIALRLMNAGSAMDVMRYAWPGGMEEEVVRCILKQALEGLNYLHINGLIHRDVKAANLLIDDDGTVLLGDLGVAAPLWDTSSPDETTSAAKRAAIGSSSFSRPGGGLVFISPASTSHPSLSHSHGHNKHNHRALGKRKSFVGTPCWMAPEVITGKQYDASADIWSFGVTALELAHGRAPYSRSAPSAALTQIATAPPPKLERTGRAHAFSAGFAEVVEMCLNKEPTKRPSAEQLLGMGWFKAAKKKGYLVGAVLKGLPPLTSRQERRRVPSVMTHMTMDSWDFTLTQVGNGPKMASPTTSVYSSRSGWRRKSKVPDEGVFEIEDEVDGTGSDREDESLLVDARVGGHGVNAAEGEDAKAYAKRMRARHHIRTGSGQSHSRSRSVSIVESIREDEEAVAQLSVSPPSGELLSGTTPPPASKLSSNLDVPDASLSSSVSRSPSSRSGSSVAEPMTPPSSTHHGSIGVSAAGSPSVPGRLWRKLVRKEDGSTTSIVTGGGDENKLKKKLGLGGLASKVAASTASGLGRTGSVSLKG